jgi:integrase
MGRRPRALPIDSLIRAWLVRAWVLLNNETKTQSKSLAAPAGGERSGCSIARSHSPCTWQRSPGAGLRNGEACALDWRDVRLASGSLLVRAAKTEAGRREVDLPLALREELTGLKQAAERSGPGQPVFVNWDGKRQTVSNLERRLKTAIRRASKRLAELGIDPIPEATTPHSLRRLYASLRSALRDDPVYIAEQGGWTDPAFALRVYARAVRRRDRLTGAALREFDKALEWAEMGRIESADIDARPEPSVTQTPETAR